MKPRLVALALLAAGSIGLARPASAHAQTLLERFAFRGEFGLGTMFAAHQRDVLGYNQADFGGALRVGFTVYDPIAVQASVANWWFPSQQGSGDLLAITGGLRFEPRLFNTLRLIGEGGAGAGFTGDATRFTFELSAGAELQPFGPLALGLLARYEHVVQDHAAVYPSDAQFGELVLQISARPGHAPRSVEREATRTTPAPTPPPEPVSAPPPTHTAEPHATTTTTTTTGRTGPVVSSTAANDDTDGDGVIDMLDQCPTVPRGPRGDPRRLGCPLADTDGDGVPDRQDECPDVAAGARPDDNHPGCPAHDADGDGVPDRDDACPDVPAGNHPRAGAPGCPAHGRR